MPQVQVHPIHFEDYSGPQFERLACAYLIRRPEFTEVAWYGQLGSDRGRDIVCVHQDGSTWIIQCANFTRLTERKAKEDIEKIAAGPRSKGAHFRLVAGGRVSSNLRDKAASLARAAKLIHEGVWSGPEFEEHLRRDTPDLVKRFVEGEVFPELPAEIAAFAATTGGLSDAAIVRALTLAFDRPAYRTPFAMESSLPRFKQAIAETIDTLNTGRKTTGRVLPSKNAVRDPALRASLDGLVERLVGLRAAYDWLVARGEVRACGCGDVDCPVHMFSPEAARQMDSLRSAILHDVEQLNPAFNARFYVPA